MEDTEGELSKITDILSTFSSEDQNELNPLQEIFGAHSSSSTLVSPEPEDSENDDQRDTSDDHYNKSKRTLMEKKRRQIIKDKVDRLLALTPYSEKVNILHTYIGESNTISPFYAAQAPCMAPPYTTPWCYYVPGIPMMPHHNIPFNPQSHQAHDTAPPDKTQ
ncbi:hypothetical protein EUTSA_v10019637mg [Eutrema salsugineum]|uniref:BHLH domain-containing protein n=1 Tax=Eutrema salsugineum TaxID=72664 RepID=V4KF46_EUTSA|nr:transcription factor bHLH109 [Eutrema salsugineum]ESQ28447.1 hypothetical protein EUTSA_v10019637mg [Eutrema salsugineum]